MVPDGDDGRRDDIILDTARQRCLDRLRGTQEPDPLDVTVVSLWKLEDRLIQAVDGRQPAHGLRGVVQAHGPHWAVGAGTAGILIALFEALGRIFD